MAKENMSKSILDDKEVLLANYVEAFEGYKCLLDKMEKALKVMQEHPTDNAFNGAVFHFDLAEDLLLEKLNEHR